MEKVDIVRRRGEEEDRSPGMEGGGRRRTTMNRTGGRREIIMVMVMMMRRSLRNTNIVCEKATATTDWIEKGTEKNRESKQDESKDILSEIMIVRLGYKDYEGG